MRLKVLTVGLLAMVSACQRADDPVSPPPSPPPESISSAKAIMVEPITVAAATFSIAASLKSLFSESISGSDIRRIRKQLDEIAAQNRAILETLGQIVGVLNNMGVIVRENVRYEAIFGKQADLMSESRQLFEAWTAEMDDRRARPQAEARYRNDILPDVRDTTRSLMDEGYGYTAFDTVGQGMLMEFWMSWRIGERRSIRQSVASSYLTYFNRALDPTLEGTPGHAHALAVAQRDRLKPILDAADARIGASGWAAVAREYQTVSRRGRVSTYQNIRETHRVTGNQNDGYTLAVENTVLRTWTETEPNDRTGPNCGRCGGLAFAAEAEAVSDRNKALLPDPADPGTDTPAARESYWNAVRQAWIRARSEADTLTQVRTTLTLYRDQAQSVQRSG